MRRFSREGSRAKSRIPVWREREEKRDGHDTHSVCHSGLRFELICDAFT